MAQPGVIQSAIAAQHAAPAVQPSAPSFHPQATGYVPGMYSSGSSPSTGAHHGIFHNLITDVLDTAKGIVPGLVQTVEHPIRSLDTAYNYEKAFYSPLVSGNFGKFWANVHSHPLTPLLDALTIGSGIGTVAGGIAKAGEAAGLLRVGAADFARPGVLGTTLKELPTSIAGHSEYKILSPNIVRRAGQRALIGATTKASEKLGATGKGASLFGSGAPLDMSPLGRGNRALNRTATMHAAGTRGAMIRQTMQIHHLLKAGANPADVTGLIYKGITNGVTDHAMQIPIEHAAQLAGRGDWSYIGHMHPIVPPEANTFEAWAKHLEDRKNVPFTLVRNPAKAMVQDGNVLVVHHAVVTSATSEASSGLRVLGTALTQPSRLWKYLVLANAPRYFVNNLIGNSVMLMASTRPDRLVRGVMQAISDVHGANVAAKALADGGNHLAAAEARLAGTWYHRWYGGTQIGPISELQQVGSKFKKYGQNVLYTGTEKVAYRGTHMVGINAAISSLPEFQTEYKLLKQQGLGRTRAFRLAADKVSANPATRAIVEKTAQDWAGQYFHSSPVENLVRHIVPFYSWDRHALRFAKEQLLARPGATNVMSQIGAQGNTYLKKSMGGNVPDFLKGSVPLPDKMGGVLTALLGGSIVGRKKVLLSGGWNPLAAAAGDVNSALSVIGQQSGSVGESFASQLSPFITGGLNAITGTSLLSGAKVKTHGGPVGTALTEAFGSVPAAKGVEGLAGLLGIGSGGQQGDVTKTGKPTLYHHSGAQTIRQILGIPVRDVSKQNLAILSKAAGPHNKKVVNVIR